MSSATGDTRGNATGGAGGGAGAGATAASAAKYVVDAHPLNDLPDKTGKKALVTGITGQDGSYLTELLLSKVQEATQTSHVNALLLPHACSLIVVVVVGVRTGL